MMMHKPMAIGCVVFTTLLHMWTSRFLKHEFDIHRVEPEDKKHSSFHHQLGVKESICSGCRLVQVNRTLVPCGQLIHETMTVSKSKNISISLVEAARQVAQKHPECHRCDPSSCNEAEKYYWRPDEPFSGYSLHQARTPMLRLPSRHRFPNINPRNFSEFIKKRQELAPSNRSAFFWEYNPSITILPKDQIPHGSNLSRNQSYYLMAVRVSDLSGCFTKEQKKLLNQKWRQDLLGLAILDSNLNILMDTVVNHSNKADHRIFNLKGQLYLGFDDSFKALWINPPSHTGSAKTLQLLKPAFPMDPHKNGFKVYAENSMHCCSSGHCQGKNFNYLVDDSGTVLVETYPSSPHIVEEVDTTNRCNRSGIQRRQSRNDESDKKFIKKYHDLSQKENSTVYITDDLPRESFGTTDEIHFADHDVFKLPYSEERGTACCVRINDPRQPDKALFVGVSHTKIGLLGGSLMKGKPGLDYKVVQYTSRLYAFETSVPYRLVAMSGRFCLGPAQGDEERMENPNNVWVEQTPYRLNHTHHSCPKITFVSAISESVDDPSQAIIGYGMNDCATRIAKVEKNHLSHLLFFDHEAS